VSRHPYVTESFSPDEDARLRGHVTNVERPVFALTGLPEVVKGALFARYSRSPKSLRRLLLDEFAGDLPDAPDARDATAGRAERLYERVFVEYGDDSVAQLGGAHVAVEQASNLLTKVLEWGRLASYLEQSTRYIPYDDRPGGRYRYYRPPEIMSSAHAEDYETTLDAVFDGYSAALPRVRAWAEERFPRDATTPERAWRGAITAKTCDVLRGMLPAATVSNVGIFASGQAYESLLLRLRSHELAEAREVGGMMLTELREVIPAFVTRVDQPERGVAWGDYLSATRRATREIADELLADVADVTDVADVAGQDEVTLTWFDSGAEVELVTGMLYPHSHLSESRLREAVAGMSTEDRRRVLTAYTGERGNRRHKPGRALERISYRFDVCSDYGAFRDLQRHRMLSIEWQDLSCRHGYDTPAAIGEAGVSDIWHEAMEQQAGLWDRLLALPDVGLAAQYAVGFAWRMRYAIHLNARAAMQMLELRTQPQGHESYRRICQRMHTLIAEQAGHPAVADMMRFVDHSGGERGGGQREGGGRESGELERLEAERRLEARRMARTG
jgi:thymidylate synthase ThyX